MSLNIKDRIRLNNGIEMPRLGLGTYQITDHKTAEVIVQYALQNDYRLIDTAQAYGNEAEVGKAVRDSEIPRHNIFVTTKLDNSNHGYDKTKRAFEESLKVLNIEYIDLFLVHWPVNGARDETWKAMESLIDEGGCRAIGVSNYTIRHLKELLDFAKVVPVVNQVEFNPFLYQKELLDFCREHGIQLEAYTPLARAKEMDNPVLKKITDKHKKSPAQVLIRWGLQHDLVLIPKTTHEERVKENANVFDFELDDDDMNELNSIEETVRVAPDPHEIK